MVREWRGFSGYRDPQENNNFFVLIKPVKSDSRHIHFRINTLD